MDEGYGSRLPVGCRSVRDVPVVYFLLLPVGCRSVRDLPVVYFLLPLVIAIPQHTDFLIENLQLTGFKL